ncbi:MAG: matrixin family metalloprotease [Acidimicrobiales bacterium]
MHALTVEPGESGTVEVTVRNDGPAAEVVRLAVGGEGRPYSYVVPDTVSLEPGAEAAVRVGFRLPRTSLPAAGPLAFDLRVQGGTEPLASGVVNVAPFSALSITLDPTDVTARGPSRHTVTVGNRGNAPVKVTLEPSTADGLDVRIDPAEVVAAGDGSASATVDVTPRRRRFTGDARTLAFTVAARPERGSPVEIGGRLVQQAAVATKRLVTTGVVAGVAVLALVLAATVFAGGSDSSSNDVAAGNGAANDACPAKNHVDTRGVSGLRPDDIPKLPNSYSFFFVKSDQCTPVRFNPCEPVHYVQNTALAPPTGAADVREAFNRLSQATGITFVDDGLTDETGRGRSHFLPDRYGQRWAPILVAWTRFGNQGIDPTIQAVGRGIGLRQGDVLVSGQLSLNVDAVTDREANTPLEGGFGPPLGSGVGAIGPKGVTWGRIILHELAHVMGLGHTRDKGAIMYPESAEQTSRPADFREPDRQGLRYLGREMGCLTTPPPA